MFCFSLGIFPSLNYRNLWHQKAGAVLFLAIKSRRKGFSCMVSGSCSFIRWLVLGPVLGLEFALVCLICKVLPCILFQFTLPDITYVNWLVASFGTI